MSTNLTSVNDDDFTDLDWRAWGRSERTIGEFVSLGVEPEPLWGEDAEFDDAIKLLEDHDG